MVLLWDVRCLAHIFKCIIWTSIWYKHIEAYSRGPIANWGNGLAKNGQVTTRGTGDKFIETYMG